MSARLYFYTVLGLAVLASIKIFHKFILTTFKDKGGGILNTFFCDFIGMHDQYIIL